MAPRPQLALRTLIAQFALLTMLFTGCVDISIINLGLPIIAKSLETTIVTTQWLITIYFISSTALLMAAGKIGDLIGHKSVFLIGTLIFGLAALFIGMSNIPIALITGRFFQGVGFALCLPAILTISAHTFTEKRRGLVVGMLSTITGLGLATGPIIGGLILEYFSWHWLFWINVPFCAVALLLGMIFIPHSDRDRSKTINIRMMLWLTVGLLCLVGTVNQFRQLLEHPWMLIISCLATGLLLVTFVHNQRHAKDPFIDFSIFNNRAFRQICWVRCISQGMIYLLFFVLGLYLINIIGLRPVQAGNILLVMTVIYGVGSIISGQLADRSSARRLVKYGLLPLILGCLWLSYMHASQNLWLLIPPLILVGLHMATTPNQTAIATQVVSKAKMGMATGTFYTVGFLGSALSVALGGLCITLRAHHVVYERITALQLHLSHRQLHHLLMTAFGTRSIHSLPHNLVTIAQTAFMDGLHIVMALAVLLGVIAWVIMHKQTS